MKSVTLPAISLQHMTTQLLRRSMPASPCARAILLALASVALMACARQDEDSTTKTAKTANAVTPAYVAMARGRVDVEGGIQRIAAPRDGVVAKLGAEVGDTVRAGQMLAVLDAQQAELSQALAQAEVHQAQALAEAQKGRLPILVARAERLRQAASAGALSEDKAEEAEQAVAELKSEQRVSAAAIATAQRRLAQANAVVDLGTVLAPVNGRILERQARAGEQVASHAPLFSIRPARPLVVRAELNENLVAQVKPGMRAEIVATGDDKVLSTAKVLRIGEMFSATRLTELSGESVDARSVECLLRLDADTLRIGMPVLVRFLP